MDHEEMIDRNRAAWAANAYRAWIERYGTAERAAADLIVNPRKPLRRLIPAIGDPSGQAIAIPLGSHGRVATALALLGAEVTVFDIAESNARYARELAAAVGVPLTYVVGDFQRTAFGCPGAFDTVAMDLGIVHYFVEIERFVASTRTLLKSGGTLVLSEFHPLVKKSLDVSSGEPRLKGDYFATDVEEAPTPCDVFLDGKSPDCMLRRWTLGEIVTAFASGGFRIRDLTEHPAAECASLPGTFTLVATAD